MEVLMGGKGGNGDEGFMGMASIPNIPGITLPDIPGATMPSAALTVPSKKVSAGVQNPALPPWWQNLTGNPRPVNAPGVAPSQRPTLLPGGKPATNGPVPPGRR
jgi:hypothetical protein